MLQSGSIFTHFMGKKRAAWPIFPSGIKLMFRVLGPFLKCMLIVGIKII